MDVQCTFSAPLYRYESNDFIRPLDLSVVDYNADNQFVTLGKFAGDLLPLANIMNARERLYDVCDADSAGWEEVYGILFEKGFEFREELGIEAAVDNVMFIWKTLLHPKLQPYRQGLYETVCTLFGSDCLVVIWRQATELSDRELSELGFRKIAGCDLLYRDVTQVSEYEQMNPNGTEVELELDFTPEDEAWVRERWKDEERKYVDFMPEDDCDSSL